MFQAASPLFGCRLGGWTMPPVGPLRLANSTCQCLRLVRNGWGEGWGEVGVGWMPKPGPQAVWLTQLTTGNTLAKLALGVTDTAVTMAAKSHLRIKRPLLLCIATNDGLGASAQNIGRLLNTKNVYFVPFGQDDPVSKPNSLVAKFELIPDCVKSALSKVQYQPVIM